MPTFERVLKWLPWCVLLSVGLLLLPFLGSHLPLPIVPFFYLVLAITVVALFRLSWAVLQLPGRRNRFDLKALKELDEREEVRRIWEGEENVQAAQSLCIHCGEVYDAWLPFCPKCKRL